MFRRLFGIKSNKEKLDTINADFKSALNVITGALNTRPDANTLRETTAIANSITQTIPHIIDAIKSQQPNKPIYNDAETKTLNDVTWILSNQIIHLINAREEMISSGVEITRDLHTALNSLAALPNELVNIIRTLDISNMQISADIVALLSPETDTSLASKLSATARPQTPNEEAAARVDAVLGTNLNPNAEGRNKPDIYKMFPSITPPENL